MSSTMNGASDGGTPRLKRKKETQKCKAASYSKVKVIALTNHNRNKSQNKPILNRSKYK